MADKTRTETIGKMKAQVRYAEWARQYEEQQASDLSVTEWCKENGINPSTYYHRLRKIREVFCDKYVEPIETREPWYSCCLVHLTFRNNKYHRRRHKSS